MGKRFYVILLLFCSLLFLMSNNKSTIKEIDNCCLVDIKNEYCNYIFLDDKQLNHYIDYTTRSGTGIVQDATIVITYYFVDEDNNPFNLEFNFKYFDSTITLVEIEIDNTFYLVYEYKYGKKFHYNFEYDLGDRFIKLKTMNHEIYDRGIINCDSFALYYYYVFVKGFNYYNDLSYDKICLNINHLLSINEIIKTSGIYDNNLKKLSYYRILDTNYNVVDIDANNEYYLYIMSNDSSNKVVFKRIFIKIVDNAISIPTITISYNEKLSDEDIINNFINLPYDVIKIQSTYFKQRDVIGEYKYYIYSYVDDYLYIDFNSINVIDNIKPIIKFLYNDSNIINVNDKKLINKEILLGYFMVYDEYSDIVTDLIGYDQYEDHYNEVGTYDITLKVYDNYLNESTYDFKIKVEGNDYIDFDYYINVSLKERKNMIDIQEYLVNEGLINNDEYVTIESEYFKSNDSGVYDLYVKRDNTIDVYKINVTDDISINKENNKKNSNNIIYVTIGISALIVFLLSSIIIWRKIYEKRH